PNWWGLKDQKNKIKHNFSKIMIKFVKDETVSMQMLEKKDLDFMGLTTEQYVKKAKGKHWGKDVYKFQVSNKAPKGYSFIGWNLRNVLFKNKNVRKALYHLVNRDFMIKKFEYGLSVPATGPQDLSSIYANPDIRPVEFNPKKALSILRKEGWRDSNKDRILDKIIDGKRVDFRFTILEPRKEFEKFLTIFKEDASKVGVDIKIKTVEWSSFLKLLNERKFEAVRLAWGGGGIDWDPKQIWHSSYAKSGSNFIGYKNSSVDKLIDKARITMDRKKRVKILHKVYKEIAEDYPYVFFFNKKYSFYGHTDRIRKKKDTYVYSLGMYYWWLQK
ncbi:MAG: ABC transporter substrate-binding protein, partial [Halobacteriovoraceae bacterium]|nr:ABC transporter substrate-binding protein [Halobacteriovoraceae bacterium]